MPDTNESIPTVTAARTKPSRNKLLRRLVLAVLALALVCGALYGFNEFRKSAIAEFFAKNQPPPIPVAVVEAKQEAMPRFLEGIGSLEAVQQVTIAPQVGGRVVGIKFESGSHVAAGDDLVQLDDGVEQGDLLSFQAQARLADANLRRTRPLAKQDFATPALMDQYQSQLDQANAGIARTKALIQQKLLQAPFAGVLGVRKIDLGQYLQPGTPVVTLTNLDTLYVNFTLPEQTRGTVAVGNTVEVRVDAYPDKIFAAKVTAIEPQIDPQTRTMRVQATLANPEHLLLPGMYANARVVLPAEPGVITLPETAVDYTAYGESVFVIHEEKAGGDDKPAFKAVQTFVKTGARYDGRVAIVSGLSPGARVAKAGQVRLHNGAAVSIVQDEALRIPSTPPVN